MGISGVYHAVIVISFGKSKSSIKLVRVSFFSVVAVASFAPSLGVSVAAAGTQSFWIWGEFDMRVDVAGEVSIEQRIQGNWYEIYHLGGASADVAVNVKVFGSNTRILGVAANSTVRYIGMAYASALVGL